MQLIHVELINFNEKKADLMKDFILIFSGYGVFLPGGKAGKAKD
jgi:hypothetical protein